MANEIAFDSEPNQTFKAEILNASNYGQCYSGTASDFGNISSYTDTNWLATLLPVTNVQTGSSTKTSHYTLNFPTAIIVAGSYPVLIFSGASPSPADVPVLTLMIDWSGSAIVSVAELATPEDLGTIGSDIEDAKEAAEAVQTQIGTAGAGLTSIGDARLANLDATMSSRLAPTTPGRTLDVDASHKAPATVAANDGADALAARTAAEAAKTNTDPLATMIAAGAFTEEAMGNVSGGLTDAQAAQLTAVKAKTDLLGTGTVSVRSMIDTDLNLEITTGDDYLIANGRNITWTNADGTWAGGDLNQADITFTVTDKFNNSLLQTTGTATSETNTQVISVEIDATNSALMSQLGKMYKYELLIDKDGRHTAIRGDITAKESLDAYYDAAQDTNE